MQFSDAQSKCSFQFDRRLGSRQQERRLGQNARCYAVDAPHCTPFNWTTLDCPVAVVAVAVAMFFVARVGLLRNSNCSLMRNYVMFARCRRSDHSCPLSICCTEIKLISLWAYFICVAPSRMWPAGANRLRSYLKNN